MKKPHKFRAFEARKKEKNRIGGYTNIEDKHQAEKFLPAYDFKSSSSSAIGIPTWQAGKIFGVKFTTIVAWCRQGKLKQYRANKTWFVTWKSIEAYKKTQGKP